MDELPDLISQRHPLKVRQGAVELILGLTSDAATTLSVATNTSLMERLWDCVADSDEQLSLSGCHVMVNITSHTDKYTPPADIVPNLLNLFQNPSGESHLFNPVAMILNNLSCNPEQVDEFSKLMYQADCDRFVTLISQGKEQGYLVAVLGNLALSPRGREFLSSPSLLPRLIAFLALPGTVLVRRNTARLLKNLALDAALHSTLTEHLPQLVYPLAGGEELKEEETDKLPLDLQYLPEDKVREPDLQTRISISDTLYQMGGTYAVRETYRDSGYYPLLRNYFYWEDGEEAKEHIELVIYLIIDDDGKLDMRKRGELPEGSEAQGDVEEVKVGEKGQLEGVEEFPEGVNSEIDKGAQEVSEVKEVSAEGS